MQINVKIPFGLTVVGLTVIGLTVVVVVGEEPSRMEER